MKIETKMGNSNEEKKLRAQQNYYLCSEHFTENDFVYSFGKKSVKDHLDICCYYYVFTSDDANIICCEGTSFRINEEQPVNEPEKGSDVVTLIATLRDRLHDPEKEVRQHALRVLADLVLALPHQSLDDNMEVLLPNLIINLGHSAPSVRRGVIDCLKIYLRHSLKPDQIISEIVAINESTPLNITIGIITAIPSLIQSDLFTLNTIKQLANEIWSTSEHTLTEEASIRSLIKLKRKVGEDSFKRLIQLDNYPIFLNMCEKYGLHDHANDGECAVLPGEDRVILETEITLESGPSITLQIHEESFDSTPNKASESALIRVLGEGIEPDYYEAARRTPRRVRFGGEIVKMRTPESDSTQPSDDNEKGSGKKKSITRTADADLKKVSEDSEVTNKIAIPKKSNVSQLSQNVSTLTKPGSRIPILNTSSPSSPHRVGSQVKKRLYNSAPNLTRQSKIPRKIMKCQVGDHKSRVIRRSSSYTFLENTNSMALNITNEISLEIKITDDSSSKSKKGDSGSKDIVRDVPSNTTTSKNSMNQLKLNTDTTTKESKTTEGTIVNDDMLLGNTYRPRRYSRQEDILTPSPIHNEVQILHNLARSPEHTCKAVTLVESEPPTSSGDYTSFQVCKESVTQGEQIPIDTNSELPIPVLASNNAKEDVMNANSQKVSLDQTEKNPPAGDKVALSSIISGLQELDLAKKYNAFDHMVNSLKDPELLNSLEPHNTKVLLQLLFLYETQSRYRNGAREALTNILERSPITVIKKCLPQVARGIGRMGAPYGVRLAVITMKRTSCTENLLHELPYESGRGREGSLQILMAACRLFPSTDLGIGNATRKALLALGDRRRRIRHAALETLASLAQVGGNSVILEIAAEFLSNEAHKQEILQVIRSRLSRRQLPIVDSNGNIRYTSPRDQQELDWLSGSSVLEGQKAPNYWRHNSRHEDELVPIKNGNVAVLPLNVSGSKKLHSKRGILRPVYCILQSSEEINRSADSNLRKYDRGRSISPVGRCGSQDRIPCDTKGFIGEVVEKDQIKKSYSSDQIYSHYINPVNVEYKTHSTITSTSSTSSGSEYSSCTGRSLRWHGSGIPIPLDGRLRIKGNWASSQDASTPNKTRPPYDSPSIKSIQRLSSGSESSGYFTPPPAERPNARVTPVDHCEPRSAVIPLSLPAVLQEIEDFCDSDTQTSQSEQPEYIEVIGSPFHLTENNNVEQEKLQTRAECDETATDYNSNTSEPGEDQVDRKTSVSSLSNFDLTQRPFEEHRAWSKSEVHLEKTLPIIVSRKNVNSAPPIKDICNNNVIEKTSIVVETLLPGALIVDEEPPDAPLVRKLSKRYSHVPVARKSSYRVVKPEASGRSSSRQKDLVQEVLTQLKSPDWETTMVGLKGLSKLARNHTELLEPNMHVVSITLATQIRNLRSQVARTACQAASEMFNTCSTKGLESELEEVATPLLHRTADTNKFLREDANNALDAMSKNMPTNKVITFVTSKGCTHQNAIVRAVAARLLDDLVKKHGAEKIFSSGRDIRDRVFLAGANALTEGSLETRKYAKSLLKNLIPHPNFQKTLMEAVPPHTIRHIAKTLNSLK